MSFRDGMLQARGQIVFIAALLCSTAAIVYLEYFDTTGRIRDQVIAAQATTGSKAPVLAPDFVGTAMQMGEDAYGADPSTAGNRAAALNAAVLGLSQGLGQPAQHRQSLEQVIATLEAEAPSAAQEVAPALALVAAAVPDLEPRVRALLARQ
ncbi:hypothetical protein [Devosia aurantiaca]|uniref:Uncharacterized protein n=1 Tax=Devosia aurantiaca TaxID=2714858 RepID=A0A6M1SGZ1_9HYPH|nr:hypothetical protein [Devosia aurantiaca]NGP16450.1 hypothetical protein [Devosia aurantiaca]